MTFQGEVNKQYFFVCGCQSNSKNIYTKCHEKILSHFQEIEEQVAPRNGEHQQKVFQSENQQNLKSICAKQTILKKQKNIPQSRPKIPQNGIVKKHLYAS